MHNVLVKGGKHLESMKDANVIVFDKTGTLTHAKPVVLDVVPLQDYTREEVLKIAACLKNISHIVWLMPSFIKQKLKT